MKILQIIQRPQLRGAEIFACQLSEQLIKLGHEVDVVYLFDQPSFDLDFTLNFISLNGKENKRYRDFSAYKRLSSLIKSGNYDIVQANAGDTLKYAAFSKKIFRWKAKLIFRNANKMSGFINSILHKRLNALYLKEIDYVISVSENCRQDIIRLYPHLSKISSTGTIGTNNFEEIKSKALDHKGPIWINVGSFVPEKNHTFLLEVFNTFYQRNNKGHLLLIGDGNLKSQLPEKLEALGLSDRVSLLGFRKDVIALLKASDIMVMPSKIEGLPGVILEALSCGKPVVASAVGGIPEVIKDSLNGYCIKEFNADKYVQKIEKILSDKQLYKIMSDNGRQLIKDQFLIPEIAQHFEATYQKLIN
ncbi:glycosyltransferase [Fulvivirga sp. RKSG066]|uniref:glycosyltransferase family 4 protein n=1 Tax=Fulvivirga aurantia TaxID=2529383 RepID=UPI0012BC9ADF|nr:glycosyltransferase family 4 protein [Fulvivirga aurantia]MTI19978.1 glycosyltransferase [Fulvivirga aurantia]